VEFGELGDDVLMWIGIRPGTFMGGNRRDGSEVTFLPDSA
jgi:hypothetical protein